MEITLDTVYAPSEDVVARVIEGELIIVPLVAGIGNMEDELYSMNGTGKTIWSHLDGEKSLRALALDLAVEFSAPLEEIEKDVIGLMAELAQRRLVVAR